MAHTVLPFLTTYNIISLITSKDVSTLVCLLERLAKQMSTNGQRHRTQRHPEFGHAARSAEFLIKIFHQHKPLGMSLI